MNLFLVGLGLSELMKSAAAHSLRAISTVYPQLDPDTLRLVQDGPVFVGTLQTNQGVAAPREYVAQSGTTLTLFTGTPLSADDTLVPHRASDLWKQWQELPDTLDGQFAAVLVDWQQHRLEVLTDPLGMEQVYIHRQGRTVVLSNSVRLIEQTCGLTALDEIGACLFLSLGWVGGDRTLRESVSVLPGGSLHRWDAHGSYTAMPYMPKARQQPGDMEALAHSMTAMIRGLSTRFGPLVCDLTGGRDSRVLAACTIASGVPARFDTAGSPSSADVKIATAIAQSLGLSHRIEHHKATAIEEWDARVRQLIRQNDGMINLWQSANGLPQDPPSRLQVDLWGGGGEIARGFYYHHLQLPPTLSDDQMLTQFPVRLVPSETVLLRRQTRAMALQSVRETCQAMLDEGVRPIEIPDAFYAYDRVRRWAATNARKFAPAWDFCTPFCTRPFLDAARAMPLADRIAWRLHPALIRATTPALLDFPFDKPAAEQVHGRSLTATLKAATPRWLRAWARPFTQTTPQTGGPPQADWVEAKRDTIREVCLSQPQSVLWDYVDRPAFERMLSSNTDAQVRRAYCKQILSIATVCYYEADSPRPARIA